MGQVYSSIYNIIIPPTESATSNPPSTETTTHNTPSTSSSPSNSNSSDVEKKETPIIKDEPLDLPLLNLLINQGIDVKEIRELIQEHSKQQSTRYPRITPALYSYLSFNSPFDEFVTKLHDHECHVALPHASQKNLGSGKKGYANTATIMADMLQSQLDKDEGVKKMKMIVGKILSATGQINFFDQHFQCNENDLQVGMIYISDHLLLSNHTGILTIHFIKISLTMKDHKRNRVTTGSPKGSVIIDAYDATGTIQLETLFPNEDERQQIYTTLESHHDDINDIQQMLLQKLRLLKQQQTKKR